MTKSEIFKVAHEQRKARSISMSLALRQVYAVRRCLGMRQLVCGQVVSHEVDIGAWMLRMSAKGALDEYGVPVC